MTALASRLRGLLKLAHQRQSPQQTTLDHGLIVRAHHQPGAAEFTSYYGITLEGWKALEDEQVPV